MKTKIVFIGVAIFAIVSCKKESNNLDLGYWNLANGQHNIISTMRSTNNGYFILSGVDSLSAADTLQIYFSTMPTTSAKYTVVQFGDNTPLTSDEMGIKVSTFSKLFFYSTGIADMSTWPWRVVDKADLTVENGKLRIEIPKMITQVIYPDGIDSVYLTGRIIEK